MHSRRFLPVLLVLFVGSGCAALVYEVVWFQLLQLVIGSSAVSLGVLLGTYMGGLCLGSLLMPRLVSPRHHPLQVYGLLELGIGLIAVVVLYAVPLVGGVYSAWAGSGFVGLVTRGLAAAICLLPPTLLMGATLPALARWVETTPAGVSWLGFFYAGNTLGAVIGSLVAGFYLLRVYDMPTATYVGVALNFAVALLAFAVAGAAAWQRPSVAAQAASPGPARTQDAAAAQLAGVMPGGEQASAAVQGASQLSVAARARSQAPVAQGTSPVRTRLAPGASLVYWSIAISGFTALSAEVIWTRLLSLLFGGSTYTFSLILAAFLLGLALGSAVGSTLARNVGRPRVVLGWCQALLCATIAWAAYMLTDSMPYWPIDPSIASTPWFNFHLDFARCLWAILPAAILWGATFPLALASAVAPDTDPAELVGGLYAANTVGAILGSLATSMVLVPWIGSQATERLMIGLAGVSALLVLWPVADLPGRRAAVPGEAPPARAQTWFTLSTLAVAGACAVFAFGVVDKIPALLVAYGRYAATRYGSAEFIYMGEGTNSSVAVSRLSNGVLNYHNAGKVQASSEPQDMRLQRMLGHLTTLVPANPRKVLVIGCGAGVTAGAVSIEPRLEQETIAEIEPLVVRTVSTYFSEHNFDVVRNPKVRVRVDDARHYILTTSEKFDAVTSDPLDPWVKGAAMLYTREFFELVKRHLNPGGAVTLFVQLYESNEEAVKSEIATFFEAFPNGIVFGNTLNGQGYDLVLVGQVEPIRINVDMMEQRLRQPEFAQVALSLRQIGFSSAVSLLSTYAGRARDLAGWLKDASINRDRDLRLQYLAGMGLNLRQGPAIYSSMLAWRQFPDDVFIGSDATKAELWGMIQNPPEW